MPDIKAWICRSVAVAALALFGSGEAGAQDRQLREGFWLGADGGYGRLALTSCQSCEPAGVRFGSVRLGGTIGSRMLAGAEIGLAGGARDLPSLAILLGTVSLYPAARSGAHLRLGFGAIGREAYSNVDGLVLLAFMAGAGYDLRVRRGISVVPSVSWVVGPGGYSTNMLRAGVGITFH